MSTEAEHVAVLALTRAARVPWYELSELLEEAGTAVSVVDGSARLLDTRHQALAKDLAASVTPEAIDEWRTVLHAATGAGQSTSFVTVLEPEYPLNLRRIYNRPPFLFVQGRLDAEADQRSLAVVGTRKPSPSGREQARELAAQLVERQVTVVSGLAAGIDTEAHTAALDAGGRTVAVMGTGIDKVYPAANKDLARRIATSGALLSQFWPSSPPRSQNFPLRNVVTSGVALGTAVIEASATSGAKMQARLALEHGKRLFLVRDLVMHEDWAQRYSQRPGAVVVDCVDDILSIIDTEVAPADQLALF